MKMTLVFAGFLSCAAVVAAQDVVINSPAAWLTQRDGTILVKAQFDTARIAKKSVKFTSYTVDNGKKSLVASKTVLAKTFSQDIKLGSVKGSMLGGTQYVTVEWALTDTAIKGSVFPVGVLAIEKVASKDSLKIGKVANGADCAAAAAAIGKKPFTKVGTYEIGSVWNDQSVFFACKKVAGSKDLVTLAIDGKNAKNAFLAYSDRLLVYGAEKDSLSAVCYKRAMVGDTLRYTKTSWELTGKSSVVNGVFVVEVPWADLGMVKSFVGRRFGFSVMVSDNTGKSIAAYPSIAKQEIPGSWTNALLTE